MIIPVGYLAKRVSTRPAWLQVPQVRDIYSVSNCVSAAFADYIPYWQHNGYWLFDSSDVIRGLAQEYALDLVGTTLFYYEAHALEYDGEGWHTYAPEPAYPTHVAPSSTKHHVGFDVVTFSLGSAPECSPLSCNGLAQNLRTNGHCLFASFTEAETHLTRGAFRAGEPGPHRIVAVYVVEWPDAGMPSDTDGAVEGGRVGLAQPPAASTHAHNGYHAGRSEAGDAP